MRRRWGRGEAVTPMGKCVFPPKFQEAGKGLWVSLEQARNRPLVFQFVWSAPARGSSAARRKRTVPSNPGWCPALRKKLICAPKAPKRHFPSRVFTETGCRLPCFWYNSEISPIGPASGISTLYVINSGHQLVMPGFPRSSAVTNIFTLQKVETLAWMIKSSFESAGDFYLEK